MPLACRWKPTGSTSPCSAFWAAATAPRISPDPAAALSAARSSPRCCAKKCNAPWNTPNATAGAYKAVSSPTPTPVDVNLWSSADHSRDYLKRADSIPHRGEGEATLLEFLPAQVGRVFDVGSGGGRLLSLVKAVRPGA